jgi:two-component system, OmpR family, sensor histidine kinase BaeS
MTLSDRGIQPSRWHGRHGIRMRLLVVNSVVVIACIATTSAVAELVGPPMFRRLMDEAVVPGLNGNHPYERAFRDATALSVGIALAVSALAALTLSWYLSRRVHRSATALSWAASAVANGQYDIRVPPPHLGKEFDAVAAAFNKMAQQLGVVDDTRRQLLADLAHEIRTPVAVLEAYMEALEDGVRSLDAETIGTLRDQTRRLTRFSIDVNALSIAERRTTSIDARWTSPRLLISTALAAFAPSYHTKGVSLTESVAADLPEVWADPERLGQVLGNLLDNALRHTRPGGRVSVTATASEDDEIVITIVDTGDGVAHEHLARLFDRFYRADAARDRKHGGAGIGLSIAKALVEAHHGRIDAHSEGPGTGCTVTLALPCPKDPDGQSRTSPSTGPAAASVYSARS